MVAPPRSRSLEPAAKMFEVATAAHITRAPTILSHVPLNMNAT